MSNTPTQYAFPIWEQTQYLRSPGNFLSATASEKGLHPGRTFRTTHSSETTDLSWQRQWKRPDMPNALLQIQEYLQGKLKIFTLPVDWSYFPVRFSWNVIKAAVSRIPFGEDNNLWGSCKINVDTAQSRPCRGRSDETQSNLVNHSHAIVLSILRDASPDLALRGD